MGCSTYRYIVGETEIQWLRTVDVTDLFRREGDVQSPDILLQMFHLSSTNDREHVWGFMQEVCNRN